MRWKTDFAAILYAYCLVDSSPITLLCNVAEHTALGLRWVESSRAHGYTWLKSKHTGESLVRITGDRSYALLIVAIEENMITCCHTHILCLLYLCGAPRGIPDACPTPSNLFGYSSTDGSRDHQIPITFRRQFPHLMIMHLDVPYESLFIRQS